MQITLRKSFEIFPEEWHVTQLVVSHDHPLLPPKQVLLLPSYCHISKEDKRQILLFKEAGLSVRQIICVMELEKQLKHGDLPFFQKDIHNFLYNIRQGNMESDAMDLLEHWKRPKEEDSRLYRLDSIKDFEKEWPLLISKFNLQGNKHVIGLYKIKQYWVPAYLRHCFFGGMTTTGRFESINAFVKRFTSSKACLMQLIRQASITKQTQISSNFIFVIFLVDLVIEEIGQTQLCHTMSDTYRGSSLRTLSPLEDQAYKVLTKFSFKKFQEELGRTS
ncbi:hypothetical protein Cgig2_008739 [Carnegiea gigantea]|uniref:Protein FAR1-RELATED SEQUENCE n=1 Tax=Carnegiea gigantea TaxID=171969 RepID=A0A9Q1QGE0_9CARY|nr:hypothetical protein Cgig2_008739 [Carnegiea gigantea]